MIVKLRAACVGIAGLGGLGSNVACLLARAGVGRLRLVDFDVVEAGNLNRQIYLPRQIGMRKADAALALLAEVNPAVRVDVRTVYVTMKNAVSLFAGCDVVVEAFDDARAKAMLVEALREGLPAVPVVAGSGIGGLGSANAVRTVQHMKNLYVCGDEETEAAEGVPLLSSRVMLCAAHQAHMVLRLLSGLTDA